MSFVVVAIVNFPRVVGFVVHCIWGKKDEHENYQAFYALEQFFRFITYFKLALKVPFNRFSNNFWVFKYVYLYFLSDSP